ncbi:signal peptidase I [Nocardioides marmoriginsengisoli]|uniref:Signal peptidase I n=1 Tax=Nocardioides marmoriginsengisoli TaxID=661483 RepID=A0A3N0CL12_9ACTN|nr:signal peptidase I [Nocardioides marmoriginsengisoli]RNL64144.1 signal peptidase I [Nocardioides marmoriginsengisoli]
MSLRSVRSVAGRAFALLAAGLVVVVLVLGVLLPTFAGGNAYTILTGSMRPTMPPGTLVVTRPVEPSQLRIGDAVTYQIKSGDPVVATHRVDSISMSMNGEYGFVMKGDANDAADPAVVRPEQIKGRVWYSVPYLAYPSLLVDGNIRRAIVMGAVVLLFGYAAFSFAGAFRDRRTAAPTQAAPEQEAPEMAGVGS